MARQLANRFFLVLVALGWQSSVFVFAQQPSGSIHELSQTEMRKLSQDRIALLKKNNEAKGTPFYFRTLFELGEGYWQQSLLLKGDARLIQQAEEKWLMLLQTKGANQAWINRVNFALGEIRLWQKNYRGAINYYNQVNSRQHTITDLKQQLSRWEGLSYKEIEKQETELLLKEYQTQADLRIEAQSRKVLCLIRLQSGSEAREVIEKILPEAIGEQRKVLEYQCVLSWLSEDKEKEATELLVKLEKQYGPDPLVEEGFWIVAQQLLGKQKKTEALFYLNQLKQNYPRGHYADQVRSLLEQLQKRELSQAVLDQKESTPSPEELFKKALSLKKSDPQQARRYCDEIIAAENQATDVKASAMGLAGEILGDKKEYAKAAGYFEMIEFFLGKAEATKAMEGLWRAGQLYEKAAMLSDAKRVYGLLIVRYPQSDWQKQAQQSLQKIGTSL